MRDIRNEIYYLEEISLHEIVRQLDSIAPEICWRMGLKDYVANNRKYYKELNSFFNNHTVEELDISSLDVTTLANLLLRYYGFNEIFNKIEREPKDYIKGTINNILRNRNSLKHYTMDIIKEKERDFFFDQLNAIHTIRFLSSLCLRFFPENEFWKEMYERVKKLEENYCHEGWIIPEKKKHTYLYSEENIDDILSAAEGGNVEAMVKMGKLYREGKRVPCDYYESYRWLHKAHLRKNKEAEYYIGDLYEHGTYVELDDGIALRLKTDAADHGVAPAQSDVAKYYLLGWPGKRDLNRAYQYSEKAMKQNHPEGTWIYALCCRSNKEPDKFEQYRLKAAKLGYEGAIKDLAHEYEREGEYKKAIEVYAYAQKYGDERFNGDILRLRKKITFLRR